MIDAFVDALTDAATDDSLRAIHIRGAGDDFCAGVGLGRDQQRRTAPHGRPRAPHSPRRHTA